MTKDLEKQIEQEERWIDYLEGELEPSFAEDLERMLENDPEAKALVEEYEGMKAFVGKVEGKDELPEDPMYFDRLHDKIMAEVSETTPAKVIAGNFNNRNISYFAAAIFVCIFSITAVIKSITPGSVDTSKQVAKMNFKQMLETAKVNDLSTVQETVMSNESDMDFMMNSDLEAINNLSDEELESLMGQL